jgi:hypothetical protein
MIRSCGVLRLSVAVTLSALGLACASGSSHTRATAAHDDGVELTWDRSRVERCRLLGYARVKDGVGAAAANLDRWDDAIAERRAEELGGNVVLRLPTPEQLLRGPDGTTLTDSPRPDDATVLGVVYRCAAPAR